MKLFKVIFEARYMKQRPDIFNFREKILQALGEKDEKLEQFTDGMQIYVKSKKIRLETSSKVTNISIITPYDLPSQMRYAKENIVKVFKQLNNVLNIQQYDRLGVRSQWFSPMTQDLETLINSYKVKFFNVNSELIRSSDDIAVVLTLSHNENKVNFSSGPMNNNQQKEFVSKSISNFDIDLQSFLFESSILIDFDYFSVKGSRLGINAISEFISNGMAEAEKVAKDTIAYILEDNDE